MRSLLQPIIQDVHERLDFFEALGVLMHEFTHCLRSMIVRTMLILNDLQLQLFLPRFADLLQFALLVHFEKLSLRAGLQLLKLILSLLKILHYYLKLAHEFALEFFCVLDLLAAVEFAAGEIKFLESSLLLPSVWRFYFRLWVLVLEHCYTDPWWSAGPRLDSCDVREVLVGPVVQDMHELLNLVEKLLVL